VHKGTGDAVEALRRGRVRLYPGGGGKFGTFSFITTDSSGADEKKATSITLPAER
jgi:PHP family Zn ribbon phosphoesterase